MLSSTLPDSESNFLGFRGLLEAYVHVDMANILRQRTTGTRDREDPRLNGDCDTLGNIEFFCLEDVPHLGNEGQISRPCDS